LAAKNAIIDHANDRSQPQDNNLIPIQRYVFNLH